MSLDLGRQPNPVMPPFAQSRMGRLVKLLIASAFYVSRELTEAMRRLLGGKPRATATAIFYHQVPKEQRVRFARQMEHLLRWAEPIRAERTEPLRCGSRYAMVTADDGWLSFIENALPELERRNVPVTIFVVSDRLGQSLGQAHDRLVSESELGGIATHQVSIGSHTSTHARLTTLDEEGIRRELRASRAKLENLLGKEVALFSFPFGAFRDELINECRDAGYKRVFLGIPSSAPRQPHEFVTGRVRVDPTDWLLEFHLKLMGAYSWLPRAINLKQRVLSTTRAALYFTFGPANREADDKALATGR